MGQSQSFTTYEDQLLKETKKRAYEVPNSAEKGTTSIYRNFEAKEGFVGYLKAAEEKEEVDLDTAWKLFTYVFYGDFRALSYIILHAWHIVLICFYVACIYYTVSL